MSEALEVVTEPKDIGPSSNDPESIIRYAIDRNADVTVIEKMMAIRRELRAEQAKEAFDTALAQFQNDCPIIVKDKTVMEKTGTSIRYKFASLDSIISQTKALLLKHGFSFTMTTKIEGEWVEAITTVTHRMGHSRDSSFKVPIDPKAFMNEQQKFAAACTYAKRYSLCNSFGIITADSDVDANVTRPKPPGPSKMEPERASLKPLVKELWDLLKDVRGTEKNWIKANQWLWQKEILDGAVPENAPELSEKRFKEVIERVKNVH